MVHAWEEQDELPLLSLGIIPQHLGTSAPAPKRQHPDTQAAGHQTHKHQIIQTPEVYKHSNTHTLKHPDTQKHSRSPSTQTPRHSSTQTPEHSDTEAADTQAPECPNQAPEHPDSSTQTLRPLDTQAPKHPSTRSNQAPPAIKHPTKSEPGSLEFKGRQGAVDQSRSRAFLRVLTTKQLLSWSWMIGGITSYHKQTLDRISIGYYRSLKALYLTRSVKGAVHRIPIHGPLHCSIETITPVYKDPL
ncbi:hypothetical protein B0O80DRAFT_431099 [Mortierella sp. GBAus27b]|nr:hypothetical protein B0O80DRAFT_431099 [Mortierella sp. GBAus27b]